jgi:CspA family cold shock protein
MIFSRIKSWFKKEKTNQKTEQEPTSKVGFVKFINRSRGYGFIRSQQSLKDVYVHVKDAKDRVYAGAKVRFEIEQSEKGLRARNVELVS